MTPRGIKRFALTEGEHWRVDPETGCWEWLKMRDERGYGRTVGGGAHRAVYAQFNGPIPEGHHIHHRCHNPGCVNPAHLEPKIPTHHLREHVRERRSVLTPEIVAEIKQRAFQQGVWLSDLAEEYGTCRDVVRDICKGRTWQEIDGPLGTPELVCQNCGKQIVEANRNRLFCSAVCRQQDWVKRNPEKARAAQERYNARRRQAREAA